MTNKNITKKTSKWLNASDLAHKYIVGDRGKIKMALERYEHEMPKYIKDKRNKTKISLCLNKSAIQQFCELSGLKILQKNLGEKTTEWLTAKELAGKYIIGDQRKLLVLLKQYRDILPESIQLKKRLKCTVLCLHKDAIFKFCELSGRKSIDENFDKNSIDEKTSEWVSVNNLPGKYIVSGYNKVKKALEKYQKDMPNDIQLKRNGRHIALHLKESAIEDFCKRAGLLQTKEKQDNQITSKWLGASKLTGKYIVGNYKKIMFALEKYQKDMPNDIQLKYSGNRLVLCLQRSAVDDFCVISGLKRVQNNVNQKTPEWLTATELVGKYIIEDRMRIKIMLNRYKNSMPEDIKFISNGPVMILCLNKNGIDRFCEISGLAKATKKISILKDSVSHQR